MTTPTILLRVHAAWDAFFFTHENVSAAVYYRIFLSVWTVCFFIPRLPYLEELYTARAIHTPHPLMELIYVPVLPLWAVWLVMSLFLTAVTCFGAGIRSRKLHPLILILLCYLFGFDVTSIRGYGQLAFFQWILLYFLPYERLRQDDGTLIQGPRWGQRLLMLQFCSVYLFTVGAKTLGGDGWLDGRTPYYAFHGHDYGSFLLSAMLPLSRSAAMVVGWLTLITELFVAIGLWSVKSRNYAMLCCVLMHLMMSLTLRVSVLFPILMIGHLPLFWSTGILSNLLLRRHAFVGICVAGLRSFTE